jgi:hypothetical protein
VREYIETFFNAYQTAGLPGVNGALLASAIHRRMIAERDAFVSGSIRKPEQYDGPPPSVKVFSLSDFRREHGRGTEKLGGTIEEVVLYNVGMTYIRSDPYTGMAMLYKYLYIVEQPSRALVLWFPRITMSTWRSTASRGNRKDVRLFRIAADAILFSDGLMLRSEL